MRDLVLLTAALVAIGATARADVVGHTITADIAGRCEQLVVAGVRKPCPPGSVSLVLTHRHTSIGVRWPDGQDFSFEVSPDRRTWRPGPGDYRLPLASVSSHGDTGARTGDAPLLGPVGGGHDVVGECRILLSPDGTVWHRLECHARDAARARYGLVLTGGGKMTFLDRGQPQDPPFMPNAPRR